MLSRAARFLSTAAMSRPTIVLDRFAARQFDAANKSTTTHIDHDAADFTQRVNAALAQSGGALVDGYVRIHCS